MAGFPEGLLLKKTFWRFMHGSFFQGCHVLLPNYHGTDDKRERGTYLLYPSYNLLLLLPEYTAQLQYVEDLEPVTRST